MNGAEADSARSGAGEKQPQGGNWQALRTDTFSVPNFTVNGLSAPEAASGAPASAAPASAALACAPGRQPAETGALS